MRNLYTRKTLEQVRALLDPETLAFVERKVKEAEAKKRRAAARKKRQEHKARMAAISLSCWHEPKSKLEEPRKARGFIDPMTTRDGFAPAKPARKRRSPSRLTKFNQ